MERTQKEPAPKKPLCFEDGVGHFKPSKMFAAADSKRREAKLRDVLAIDPAMLARKRKRR